MADTELRTNNTGADTGERMSPVQHYEAAIKTALERLNKPSEDFLDLDSQILILNKILFNLPDTVTGVKVKIKIPGVLEMTERMEQYTDIEGEYDDLQQSADRLRHQLDLHSVGETTNKTLIVTPPARAVFEQLYYDSQVIPEGTTMKVFEESDMPIMLINPEGATLTNDLYYYRSLTNPTFYAYSENEESEPQPITLYVVPLVFIEAIELVEGNDDRTAAPTNQPAEPARRPAGNTQAAAPSEEDDPEATHPASLVPVAEEPHATDPVGDEVEEPTESSEVKERAFIEGFHPQVSELLNQDGRLLTLARTLMKRRSKYGSETIPLADGESMWLLANANCITAFLNDTKGEVIGILTYTFSNDWHNPYLPRLEFYDKATDTKVEAELQSPFGRHTRWTVTGHSEGLSVDEAQTAINNVVQLAQKYTQ